MQADGPLSTDGCFVLFDDATAAPEERASLHLTRLLGIIEADAGTAPAQVFADIAAARAAGHWLALAVDYEFGYRLEPCAGKAPDGRPLVRAYVFEQAERLDRRAADAVLGAHLGRLSSTAAGVVDLKPALDADTYAEAIGNIRTHIAAGDCYQVNFTFPLNFRSFGDPVALYARLRARQPVAYGACLVAPGATILSLSPELFVEKCAARLLTRPMKGTARRGETADEDAAWREYLAVSAKDRAENVMIVDLLRNDLGRIATPGSVMVPELCAIEAYPTLWQMVSTVCAEAPGADLGEVLAALFPCGSITGAPKIAAMRIAAELEGGPRGIYTGAVGWLAPSGDFRLNVAIRTLEIDASGQGRMGVGSGVVFDSTAASEYAECLLKGRFLTGLDPGLRLIETLRLELRADATWHYPRLAGHLARLAESAAALGFTCHTERVRDCLDSEARRHAGSDGTYRVRLTLGHAGDVELATTPLADAGLPTQILIAEVRIDSGNPLLRHKTTERLLYDRALAALTARPEIFDVVFLNARGEVCEGARSNVFARLDGLLCTPPLACGLLPGVLRAELLAAGAAVERVLRLDDLRRAEALYCGNALRGLVPVTLAA